MSHQRRTSITWEIPSKEDYNMPDDKKQEAKRVAAENGMYVITPALPNYVITSQSYQNHRLVAIDEIRQRLTSTQNQPRRSSCIGRGAHVPCFHPINVRTATTIIHHDPDYFPAPTSPNPIASSRNSARPSSSSSQAWTSPPFPAAAPSPPSRPSTSSGPLAHRELHPPRDRPWRVKKASTTNIRGSTFRNWRAFLCV